MLSQVSWYDAAKRKACRLNDSGVIEICGHYVVQGKKAVVQWPDGHITETEWPSECVLLTGELNAPNLQLPTRKRKAKAKGKAKAKAKAKAIPKAAAKTKAKAKPKPKPKPDSQQLKDNDGHAEENRLQEEDTAKQEEKETGKCKESDKDPRSDNQQQIKKIAKNNSAKKHRRRKAKGKAKLQKKDKQNKDKEKKKDSKGKLDEVPKEKTNVARAINETENANKTKEKAKPRMNSKKEKEKEPEAKTEKKKDSQKDKNKDNTVFKGLLKATYATQQSYIQCKLPRAKPVLVVSVSQSMASKAGKEHALVVKAMLTALTSKGCFTKHEAYQLREQCLSSDAP